MKTRTYSKLLPLWLRSAGLALVIFLTMTNTNSGDSCTTAADFKSLIIADNSGGGSRVKTEVTFKSFKVSGPQKLSNPEHNYGTVTDRAYKVETDYDVIRKTESGTFLDQYRGAIYMCYPYGSRPCFCAGMGNNFPKETKVLKD